MLALDLLQAFPFRADGEACHEYDVEGAANHGLDACVAATSA